MDKIDKLRIKIKNIKSIDTVFLFIDKFNDGYKVDIGTRGTLKELVFDNKESVYKTINKYISISLRVNIMVGFSIEENLIKDHHKCKVVTIT